MLEDLKKRKWKRKKLKKKREETKQAKEKKCYKWSHFLHKEIHTMQLQTKYHFDLLVNILVVVLKIHFSYF